MPELPEVETTLNGIKPYVFGQCLERINIHQPQLRWPVPTTQVASLQGQKVTQLDRRGKYIRMYFGEGVYLLWHLGMSGSLRIVDSNSLLKKHDHIELFFSNGLCLRYHDPRRFGCLQYHSGAGAHALLDNLGPEPLSIHFNGDYLKQQSIKKTQAVKNFIMDGHTVVGVGNIYASESLFMAGIHPLRQARLISSNRYNLLASSIKTILIAAIEQGGTTLNDFLNPQGQPGYFMQKLMVYGRAGQLCKKCNEGVIQQKNIGQRNSFYCLICQR